MRFGVVPDPTIRQLTEAQRLLQPAIERAEESSWCEVLLLLSDDRAQLWLAVDGDVIRGACVTKLTTRRAAPCVEVWLMGGVMDTIPFISMIEAAAADAGAERVTLTGRVGWGRVLNDYGYRVVAVELEKSL